ncbi:MAG: nucleotidyltransferase family protein [Armatimonadota bacterium]
MPVKHVDIAPEHLQIVRDILNRHVPQHHVMVFGSRAKGTARRYSDLDLALMAESRLPFSVQCALEEEFEESDLPYRVDVIDFAGCSESFQRIITRDAVELG